MKKKLTGILMLLSFFFLMPMGIGLAAFTNIVSVGDSLTDNGTSPSDPYGIKYFTDDITYAEKLANHIDANLYDVAFGGATTSWDNPAAARAAGNAAREAALAGGYSQAEADAAYDAAYAQAEATGLQIQTGAILPSYLPLPMEDTLFTLWAGANDYLNHRSADAAVLNIMASLDNLVNLSGAQNILVPNLPNMGATPWIWSGTSGYDSADAEAWCILFNDELADALETWGRDNLDVSLFSIDVFTLFSVFTPGTELWRSMFWVDGFHPSSLGHDLLFEETARAIGNPVPEPSSFILFGISLLALAGIRRK